MIWLNGEYEVDMGDTKYLHKSIICVPETPISGTYSIICVPEKALSGTYSIACNVALSINHNLQGHESSMSQSPLIQICGNTSF